MNLLSLNFPLKMLRRLFVCQRDVNSISTNKNVRLFSFKSLQEATSNFNTVIGEGGFGSVFKGVLREGNLVAVKKLHTRNRRYNKDEFLLLVSILSRIQHRNVNRVLGCCIEGGRRILVSEYEHHGDLSNFLSGSNDERVVSCRKDWECRANLCIGIARGLSYLQEDVRPNVIHGDIKSSNILLDGNFDPKIADFDLVEFLDYLDHKVAPKPHPEVTGSMGYLDPEYTTTHVHTGMADVYSFGIVMLEIISGRNPLSFPEEFPGDAGSRSMFTWALRLRNMNRVSEIVDPVLISPPLDEVKHFVDVAILCCQERSSLRPRMSQVVHMLYGGSNLGTQAMRMLKDTKWTVDSWVPKPPLHLNPRKGEFAEIAIDSKELICQGTSSNGSTMTKYTSSTTPSFNKEKQVSMVCDKKVCFQELFKKTSLRYSSAGSSIDNSTRKSQTMVLKTYPENTSMEAVYPPLLTGVTRRPGLTF